MPGEWLLKRVSGVIWIHFLPTPKHFYFDVALSSCPCALPTPARLPVAAIGVPQSTARMQSGCSRAPLHRGRAQAMSAAPQSDSPIRGTLHSARVAAGRAHAMNVAGESLWGSLERCAASVPDALGLHFDSATHKLRANQALSLHGACGMW
jgi:hypothetical protein